LVAGDTTPEIVLGQAVRRPVARIAMPRRRPTAIEFWIYGILTKNQ
jgi:hypothetical protein